MSNAYAAIVADNLAKVFADPAGLARRLPAKKDADAFVFKAFGQNCRVAPDGIFLGDQVQTGPLGIVISLYALHRCEQEMIEEPFVAFKEMADTGPYQAAFTARSEKALAPDFDRIRAAIGPIMAVFGGHPAPPGLGGDLAFVVYPFPRVALCYIGYGADEEFPAAFTCLFSHNARCFLPVDGLADMAEHMAAAIGSRLGEGTGKP